jgi:2-keto-4-pentenoate hydratase/2-oxohepta-3-ene-1,7-dioic acid hydratase in catechol pathway
MQRLRLVVFRHALGEPVDRVGLFFPNKGSQGGSIVDFTSEYFEDVKELVGRVNSMNKIIEGGEKTLEAIREISKEDLTAQFIAARSVLIRPPISPIRNIMCVGKNYADHIAEVNNRDSKDGKSAISEHPKFPMFFTKAPQCVIGHEEKVESHSNVTKWLDYEAELAVVIGKECRDVSPQRALDKVFGYTCANDVTARDLQRRHGQFFKGKSLDTFCPLGPCIVPASDLDPSDLAIKLYLNGDVKQNSRTSKMIFDIPHLIASLSEGFTLYPGDVILTGTPDGVAYAASPPFSVKKGDHMKVEIESIGILENAVEK